MSERENTAVVQRRTRALVIEDLGPVRRSIVAALQEEGIAVEEAATLEAALALLATASFHLVVLDLNLSDSEGLHTLRRLRPACPVWTAILVVTGQSGASEGLIAQELAHEGAYRIYEKPVDLAGLVSDARYGVQFFLGRQKYDPMALVSVSSARWAAVFERLTDELAAAGGDGATEEVPNPADEETTISGPAPALDGARPILDRWSWVGILLTPDRVDRGMALLRWAILALAAAGGVNGIMHEDGTGATGESGEEAHEEATEDP